MTIRKHKLELSGDGSGVVTDTGGYPAFGTIDQVRWVPDSQDTGPANIGTLTLFLKHNKEADTGLAAIVWTEGSLVLGNDVHRVPRQPHHGVDGSVQDTGNNAQTFFASEDTLMARFTPGDTGLVAGQLHVYVGDAGQRRF